MGEFIATEGAGDNPASPPKIFSNEFITAVVKKSIENGDMPADHKLAFIGVVDESGLKAIISAQIIRQVLPSHDLNVKLQAIFSHEWTGENRAGAQLLFSVK